MFIYTTRDIFTAVIIISILLFLVGYAIYWHIKEFFKKLKRKKAATKHAREVLKYARESIEKVKNENH